MINIAIVEDHTLFRKGVVSLLASIKDFKIVAEYQNGKEFIDDLFNSKADLVLMDINMPELNGIEASKISTIKKPDLKILALSMNSDQKYYYEMIKAGVSGFVLKQASPEELEKAIRDVYSGMGFFSPKLLQQAIIGSPEEDKKKHIIDKLQLSERELEILELLCKGLTSNQISKKLFLSPRTVESHKARLMSKTDTKNTASLIIFAVKSEIINI